MYDAEDRTEWKHYTDDNDNDNDIHNTRRYAYVASKIYLGKSKRDNY